MIASLGSAPRAVVQNLLRILEHEEAVQKVDRTISAS
jgi:hypothetical protein